MHVPEHVVAGIFSTDFHSFCFPVWDPFMAFGFFAFLAFVAFDLAAFVAFDLSAFVAFGFLVFCWLCDFLALFYFFLVLFVWLLGFVLSRLRDFLSCVAS
jgi:hypothetical protein